MKLFISDKVNSKTNCPRCNSRLQNEYQNYIVTVKEGGETHHLTIGCEGGYFCPECPTAVLNSQTFEEIISQNVQSRKLEYAILGMIDIDAIDEDKQDIPLGDDDNPIPLIEFEYTYSNASDRKKKIGRNEPCPCGSGKKYKYCCMNKS